MFRKLTLDKCDVALVSESEIPMAMSGAYNKLSCEKEDAGEEGWEQGASGCERHVTGEPSTTRDCRQFRNTGDIVMQVCTRSLVYIYIYTYIYKIYSRAAIYNMMKIWVSSHPWVSCRCSSLGYHVGARLFIRHVLIP